MTGQSVISPEILATYAADAATDVPGVRRLVESHVPRHRGVRISEEDGRVVVEVHVAVGWGTSIPAVGSAVQERVRDYLGRMADLEPAAVNVIVDAIETPE